MVQIKNFSEALEKDLQRLNVEIESRRKEDAPTPQTERAFVRQSFERIAETAPMPQLNTQPIPQPSVAPVRAAARSTLPGYLEKGEQPEQVKQEVERLVSSVFSQGIAAAVKESKQHSAFVQDAFHDALVDKLLPELKRRGMI